MNKNKWFELMEQSMKVEMAIDANNIPALTEECVKLYSMIYNMADNAAEEEGWYSEFERHMDNLIAVKNDR